MASSNDMSEEEEKKNREPVMIDAETWDLIVKRYEHHDSVGLYSLLGDLMEKKKKKKKEEKKKNHHPLGAASDNDPLVDQHKRDQLAEKLFEAVELREWSLAQSALHDLIVYDSQGPGAYVDRKGHERKIPEFTIPVVEMKPDREMAERVLRDFMDLGREPEPVGRLRVEDPEWPPQVYRVSWGGGEPIKMQLVKEGVMQRVEEDDMSNTGEDPETGGESLPPTAGSYRLQRGPRNPDGTTRYEHEVTDAPEGSIGYRQVHTKVVPPPKASSRRSTSSEDEEVKKVEPNWTPTRKVASYTAGGAVGGHLAVLVAYMFPELPTEVSVALTSLIVIAIGFAAGFLVPPERS